MRKIVSKFITEVNDLLSEKQMKLRLSESAVDELVRSGFDSKMGARPLQRKINEEIKVPLSKKILFDDIPAGSQITADFIDSEYVFSITVPDNITHRIDDDGFIILEE